MSGYDHSYRQAKKDADLVLTVLLTLLALVGVLAILAIATDDGGKARAACEAKGGRLIYLRDHGDVCFERGVIL